MEHLRRQQQKCVIKVERRNEEEEVTLRKAQGIEKKTYR